MTGNLQNRRCMAYSMMINTLLFMGILFGHRSYYGINDDTLMCSLVSGAYNGNSYHELVFINQPLGWILSGLYQLIDVVSWYGLMHGCAMLLSSTILLYYLLRDTRHFLGVISLYVIFAVCVLSDAILFPQFTTTAAFLSAAVCVCVYKLDYAKPLWESRKKLIGIVLLAVFSVSMRYNLMLMMFPVAGLAVLTKAKSSQKELLRGGIVLTSLLVCIAFIKGGTDLVDSDAMKTWKEHNEVRSKIADYMLIPAYDEEEELYQKWDITDACYDLLKQGYYHIVSEQMSDEMLTEIVETAREGKWDSAVQEEKAAAQNVDLEAVWDGVWKIYQSDTLLYGMVCIRLLVLMTLALSVLNGSGKKIFFSVFCAGGILCEAAILVYTGRFVVRVGTSMIIALFFLYMCVFGEEWANMMADKNRNQRMKRIVAAFWGATASLCLLAGHDNLQVLREKEQRLQAATEKREALYDYAAEHSQYFYYYDPLPGGMTDASSKVWETETFFGNVEKAGGWLGNSYMYREKIGKYGMESFVDGAKKGIVRFVSMTYPQTVERYLNEYYGDYVFEAVDTIGEGGWIVFEIREEK